MKKIIDKIRNFLDAVPGSLKNHLNVEELSRVSIAALTAGGGVYGLLQAVMLAAGTIFPAPADSALAAIVLASILDVCRRLGHGTELPRQYAPYQGLK